MKGSNADKEFMTSHLLMGIVADRVVDNVIDTSWCCGLLDNDSRKILQDLWRVNLKNIGGLPVQQKQQRFDLESIRMSQRLSEYLPPMIMTGQMRRPEARMQRPMLDARYAETKTGIRESYVVNSVRKSSHTVIICFYKAVNLRQLNASFIYR